MAGFDVEQFEEGTGNEERIPEAAKFGPHLQACRTVDRGCRCDGLAGSDGYMGTVMSILAGKLVAARKETD